METRISELKAATLDMIDQSIESYTVGESKGRFKAMSDEMKALCDMLKQYRQSCHSDSSIEKRMSKITEILQNELEDSTTYNDTLVRQLIQTIQVMVRIGWKSPFNAA